MQGNLKAQAQVDKFTKGTATEPALDPNSFDFYPSTANHLCIKDSNGVVLLYRLRIPSNFTDTLNSSDHLIPYHKYKEHKRGEYTARIWALWKQSAKEPRYNSEYEADNKEGKADEWLKLNNPLFNYLSNTVLRNLDPNMYDKFNKLRKTLPEGLSPMGGVWFGVAIGQGMTGGGNPHIDNNDSYSGYNVVTTWGSYTSSRLNIWDIKKSVEIIPGDAVLFFGRGMVHNASHVTGGVRNLVDLFSHQNVLNWHQAQMGQNASYHKEKRAEWVGKGDEDRRQE